jgi:malate dehydrogenase (oxaloacetate-decarboxylating)(NADP+)
MEDFGAYRERLEASLSLSQQFMRSIRSRAKGSNKRIIFSDGEHPTIIRAVHTVVEEKFARPVLVGRAELIRRRATELGVDLGDTEILDPHTYPERKVLAQHYYEKRKRKGISRADARFQVRRPDWFAALKLDMGRVDGMVCGIGRSYPIVMRALLECVPLRDGVQRISGMYIALTKDEVFFLADCTAQVEPTAEQLAETAILAAQAARYFDVTPRVAMLSFSNFGSVRHPEAEKVSRAVKLVNELEPDLCIDGEMQVDTALAENIEDSPFPFCKLKGRANVLIFPGLSAGLISAQLVTLLGAAELIGPLTLGLSKPLSVLHLASDASDVVNATLLTVIESLDRAL